MVDSALTEKVLLATGGYDHTIKLWHANTGVCNRSLTHLDSVSFIILLKTTNVQKLINYFAIVKRNYINNIEF